MATAMPAPEAAGTRDRRGRAWQVGRWLVLAMYVGALLTTVLVGIQHSSLSDLEDALSQGEVSQVRVEGSLEGPRDPDDGVEGVVTVRLVWWDGWRDRVAEVRQASSAAEAEEWDTGDDLIVGEVEPVLREANPDVDIIWADYFRGGSATFLGWDLRDSWQFVPVAAVVSFLVLLPFSGKTRGASPWGWFWLALSPLNIVAIPVFLVLAGRPPVPGRRGLAGGVAFLIFLLLGS